ncbi:ATP-binding protein, partial [Aestuariivirga sp.]|uniref:ATP-binding protein n=1 Tax=Aestuariivirga sp. TaxID=2650926 RepID=UPI003784C68B
MSTSARQLSRMTVTADQRFLRAACLFMKEMALAAGLDEQAAANLELATEEAGLLIINHSFEGIANGTFDIVCEYENGRFVAAFEDKGLPFEWSKVGESEKTRQSVVLLSGFSDELRLINRGKEGKRLEFVVNRSSAWLETSFRDAAHDEELAQVAAAPIDTPLQLRPLDPAAHGVSLARCMYNVYGFSYLETVYFPERIRSLIDQGLLLSYVAVTDDSEVIGHQGLKKERPDSLVANISMGIVDPRFRGRKLFERLKEMAIGAARASGMVGLYGEAIALHPYSQKANFGKGGRETGILLGYVPEGFTLKKIKDGEEAARNRQSAILFYNPLNPGPSRVVYPPSRDRQMIRRIYDWVQLERTLADATAAMTAALPARAEITVDVAPAFGQAVISVVTPGLDLPRQLRDQLNELKLSRVDVIYVDLPLSHPATQLLAEEVEACGLSFCGIYPEKGHNGDLLRLHHLNNVRVDLARVTTVTDMGRDLLDYV